METAQNPASQGASQVEGSRLSSWGRDAVAWFCVLMAFALGWPAMKQVRPRQIPTTQDLVYSARLHRMVPDPSGTIVWIKFYPTGIQSVFPALLLLLFIPLLRRRPVVGMSLVAVGSLLIGLNEPNGLTRYLYFVAVDAAILALAVSRPRRTALTAGLIAWAGMVANVGFYPMGSTSLMPTHVFVVSLMAVLAWLIGDTRRARRSAARRLREETAASAVAKERLRIARELHDMIAHSIGIIAIQAGMGSRIIGTQPDEARNALRAIEETSRETLSQLRRTLIALRHNDSQAAEHEPAPGLADLDKLITATRHAGLRVDLARRGIARPLPPDIDLAAYRIVQESLTNVVRHSGTNNCRVVVSYAGEDLALEVIDNGPGALGTSGTGFGLVGMRERVSLLHGDFSAGPRPGGGFKVSARLPIPGFATSYRTVKHGAVGAAAGPGENGPHEPAGRDSRAGRDDEPATHAAVPERTGTAP